MAATVFPHTVAEPVDPHRPPWSQRVTALLAPALVYLTIRQLSLLVLAWMCSTAGKSASGVLSSWDGAWFLALAEGGYDHVPAGLTDAFGARTEQTPLAFFPGYPALIATISRLSGVGATVAAFTISAAAGVIAAYGLVRLAELVPGGSRRAGLLLVALFAAAPLSIVLSMTYSEALFCALAVWCLVGLLRGQWLLAGTCAALAGPVRPTAVALVVTVVLAAMVAVLPGRRSGRRPWVAALIAPLGLIGYLAFVAVRTDRWDGWFALQRQGWNSGFDGGAATMRFIAHVLTTAPSVLEVTTSWLLVGALILLAVGVLDWWRSPAWPLLVYAGVVVAMDLGSSGLMNSKARLLVPAFVLLVPVAIDLARRRTVVAVLTLTVLTAFGAWFGGYALTVWRYAI